MMTTSVATDVAIDNMGTAKVDMKLVAGVLAEGVRPLAHLLVRRQAACALNLGSLALPPGLGVTRSSQSRSSPWRRWAIPTSWSRSTRRPYSTSGLQRDACVRVDASGIAVP